MRPSVPHSSSIRTGVWSAKALRDRGVDRIERERLLRQGKLVRIRHGWYRERDALPYIVAAVHAGGVLSCASAATFYSQNQRTPVLHVRAPRQATLRFERQICRCRLKARRQGFLGPTQGNGLDSPWNAVLAMLTCIPLERAERHIEALIGARVLSKDQIQAIAAFANKREANMLRYIDGLAESYLEASFRQVLRRAGIRFRQQVWLLDGLYRADFLIGVKLIVEVDGAATHATPEGFARDRVRDAELALAGYRVLRFTYWQVENQPEVCLAVIRSVMASKGHR